ncbi:MAG: hypothetical protein WD207_04985, partial [Xanthobacteraceae bacterium]
EGRTRLAPGWRGSEGEARAVDQRHDLITDASRLNYAMAGLIPAVGVHGVLELHMVRIVSLSSIAAPAI